MTERRNALCRHAARAPLLLAGLLAGCVSAPPPAPPEPYDALAERAAAGEPVDALAIRRAFLDAPDFDARLRRLTELERQLIAAPRHDPLRLGPLGSAALDEYYGSLAGHRVLARFYRHLELPEQADLHDAWAAAVEDAIAGSAEGSLTAPYVALSANEAEAFLDARGLTVAGKTYHATEAHPLLLWVATPAEDGPMRNVYFDLHDAYKAIEERVAAQASVSFPAGPPEFCQATEMCDKFDIAVFLNVLALGGDSAAQTWFGSQTLLASRFDQSAGWLLQAARADNDLAIPLLARLALDRTDHHGDIQRRLWLDRAERWLLQAIEAGFDDAMYTLGGLYLAADRFGPEKVGEGRRLLARAAEVAERYFLLTGDRHEPDVMHHVLSLMHPEVDVELDARARAYRWLRDEARNDDPQAMVQIARLYATGVHVPKSLRRARSWYKRAAKAAPDNPHWANYVAWTLTVSPAATLRDERFALKIMDRVMSDEKNVYARSSPAYLDTWAATIAANGDFERAIAVQEEALAIGQAKSDDESKIVKDLKKHLESFRAGMPVREEVH